MPEPETNDDIAERTVLLDAPLDEVLDALERPDLLSAWLGPWTEHDAHATVVTDDGVTRRVDDIVRTVADDGTATIAWRWSPVDEPEFVSDVVLTVIEEAGATRLTVTECIPLGSLRAGAPVTPVPWLPSLLALGAVLAVGAPVPA